MVLVVLPGRNMELCFIAWICRPNTALRNACLECFRWKGWYLLLIGKEERWRQVRECSWGQNEIRSVPFNFPELKLWNLKDLRCGCSSTYQPSRQMIQYILLWAKAYRERRGNDTFGIKLRRRLLQQAHCVCTCSSIYETFKMGTLTLPFYEWHISTGRSSWLLKSERST